MSEGIIKDVDKIAELEIEPDDKWKKLAVRKVVIAAFKK